MPANDLAKCFVIMPFGIKPIHNEGGRRYDFDKVYRVIIRRAILQAGMEPVRADERKGSNLIHIDMFRDLRDQAVVLADLSLHNPNVFYELGIRHVMSPKGTVLICRNGSDLPFDVKLSRVVFYQYDGESLDWEEAERVTKELQHALEQAKRGMPDSPVYALLEQVLSNQELGANSVSSTPLARRGREALESYERLVAEHWSAEGKSLADLQEQHGSSVFGTRSLAYFCLAKKRLPEDAWMVAHSLYDVEQYALANKLFAKLAKEGALSIRSLLIFGSSLSEAEYTVQAVEQGIELETKALELVQEQLKNPSVPAEVIEDLAIAHHMLAGLYLWKWELTRTHEDLERSVSLLEAAVKHCEEAVPKVNSFPLGRLAQARLKLMLMLRVRDRNRDRPDVENHREAILALKPTSFHSISTISYLRWYQAITLADAGDAEGSRRMALIASLEDAKRIGSPDGADIGRRQYSSLRRFLEQYSHSLRNRSLVGQISQLLQLGQFAGNNLLES